MDEQTDTVTSFAEKEYEKCAVRVRVLSLQLIINGPGIPGKSDVYVIQAEAEITIIGISASNAAVAHIRTL